jgi:L-amino acid N-acyltransferase YncA
MMEDALEEQYPRDGRLKNEKTYTVRMLSRRDSHLLYRFFRQIPREDRLFMPEDVSDKSVVESLCKQIDLDREVPLVVEVEGQIAGYAALYLEPERWMHHVGRVNIIIQPDQRRQGLALILLKEVTNLALHTGYLEELTARCMDSQEGAIWMFENAGFIPRGTLPGQVRDLDGELHDLVVLSKNLRDQDVFAMD